MPHEEVRTRLHLEAPVASQQGDRPERRSFGGYKLRTPTLPAQDLFFIPKKLAALNSLCDRLSAFTLGQTDHPILSPTGLIMPARRDDHAHRAAGSAPLRRDVTPVCW